MERHLLSGVNRPAVGTKKAFTHLLGHFSATLYPREEEQPWEK